MSRRVLRPEREPCRSGAGRPGAAGTGSRGLRRCRSLAACGEGAGGGRCPCPAERRGVSGALPVPSRVFQQAGGRGSGAVSRCVCRAAVTRVRVLRSRSSPAAEGTGLASAELRRWRGLCVFVSSSANPCVYSCISFACWFGFFFFLGVIYFLCFSFWALWGFVCL